MKYFDESLNLDFYDFSNSQHVENHLNYLFRTDKAQKWTNELTAGNFVLFLDEKANMKTFTEDKNKRLELKEQAKNIIKKNTKSYKDLWMCRIDSIDKDAFVFDKEFIHDSMEVCKNTLEYVYRNEDMQLLLMVGHQDQTNNYLHLHFLLSDIR